jgi:3-hydroxybutyryl-CoA dehydrogenase
VSSRADGVTAESHADTVPSSNAAIAVAIIGAGRLGRSFALRAARAGFRVFLEDVMPSNLRRAREALLEVWGSEAWGLEGLEATEKKAEGANHSAYEAARSLTDGNRFQNLSQTSAPEKLLPVAFVSSIEDAVRQAALVIDCVPDELESKLEILWLLDRMAPPHAVFATPTTALSIRDLAACTYRPDKCVALAVEPKDMERFDLEKGAGAPMEMRTTPSTSGETVALLERFWRALGFEPVFRLEA